MTILIPINSRKECLVILKRVAEQNAKRDKENPKYHSMIIAELLTGEFAIGLGCCGLMSKFTRDFPYARDYTEESKAGKGVYRSAPFNPDFFVEVDGKIEWRLTEAFEPLQHCTKDGKPVISVADSAVTDPDPVPFATVEEQSEPSHSSAASISAEVDKLCLLD